MFTRRGRLLLLFLILFALFLFFLLLQKVRIESFQCKDQSFCAYDTQKESCVCARQKDDARLQFPNDPDCCDRNCSTLSKEQCMGNDMNVKYYCNVSGKCKEYNAYIQDSVIMGNICGIDNVTNQYIMPYASKEQCEKSSDVCAKYNDEKLSVSEREKGCLQDTNCGMCYNEEGKGKCVSGSPMGPNDMSTYYFCKPNERKSNGSNQGVYKYGKLFSN